MSQLEREAARRLPKVRTPPPTNAAGKEEEEEEEAEHLSSLLLFTCVRVRCRCPPPPPPTIFPDLTEDEGKKRKKKKCGEPTGGEKIVTEKTGGERRTCGVSNNRFLAALDAELAELSQQILATCVHGAINW